MSDPSSDENDAPAGERSPVGRAAFYIDGFNFYHALDELGPDNRHLKWLDWQKLAALIAGPAFQIVKIVLCSAPPKHRPPDVQERHRRYMDAMRATGVAVQEGWFLGEPQKCRECGHTWEKYSEKEGDVSLALALAEDAYADVYDSAFLVSSDSDQAPTLRLIGKAFGPASVKPKAAIAVFPSWRGENSTSRKLTSCAADSRRIGKPMLNGCLLPQRVRWQVSEDQLRLIYRPPEYDPPGAIS